MYADCDNGYLGSVSSDLTYDEETETYYLDLERDQQSSLATTIVLAIATISSTDPAELPVLNDVINPEALDAFFTVESDGDVAEPNRVGFTYSAYQINVYSNGQVVIRSPDSE